VLDGDGLQVVFQPIVRLTDRAVVGYEGLSRFDGRPTRSPDRWFEEAAEVGLLVSLELAAVRAAMERLHALPGDAYFSINLSPATAASSAFEETLTVMAASRIVLEITEHAVVEDYGALNASLRKFRDLGVRLAIDDAGAGFASLRHILLLRPDVIKLDISLTRDIDKDDSRRSLARALISFATDVGADIVAEGIETGPELEALLDLGVLFGQGFYTGRPAPATDSSSPSPETRRRSA
jgi:EAL domain-containing protein (putative c-di-GMP-specific phosphodiesterase class I)